MSKVGFAEHELNRTRARVRMQRALLEQIAAMIRASSPDVDGYDLAAGLFEHEEELFEAMRYDVMAPFSYDDSAGELPPNAADALCDAWQRLHRAEEGIEG